MTAHHRLQHACIMCHPRHWVMAAHSHADFNELLVVTEGGIETAIRRATCWSIPEGSRTRSAPLTAGR